MASFRLLRQVRRHGSDQVEGGERDKGWSEEERYMGNGRQEGGVFEAFRRYGVRSLREESREKDERDRILRDKRGNDIRLG